MSYYNIRLILHSYGIIMQGKNIYQDFWIFLWQFAIWIFNELGLFSFSGTRK